MNLQEHRIRNSVIIFIICLAVHAAEVFFLRTDETIFAECFVNKVFGIIMLFVLLKMWGRKWSDIGFKKPHLLPDCFKGFLICTVFYTIGFAAEFITLSAVLKIGLSGLTMAYYLNKRQGRQGVEAYTGAFIGGFYALSGWMAAYSWVVMWLDCIWLFPLIILGLERLVRENKGLLYCVSLSATIFCSSAMAAFPYCP